uniref:HIG1 domain-containing protein n=1 Tax=Ciona intestinalis TaxID=7719 RepID=H2XS33_CIOIN
MDNVGKNSFFDRVKTSFQKRPSFFIASTALTGIVGAGLYGLRNRKLRLSLYLINMRLAAQGTFVAIMTVGATVALVNRVMQPSDSSTDVQTKR